MDKKYIILLLSFLIVSCSGISYNEYQDAETLGSGNGALTFGILPPEGRFQFPLSESTDAGISLWSFNILNPKNGDRDIGIKLGLKHSLSEKSAKSKWALITNIFGYNASFSITGFIDSPGVLETDKYSAFGVSPGIIFSYRINEKSKDLSHYSVSFFENLKSLYAGLKINYLYSDAESINTFDSTKSSAFRNELFLYPFAGVVIGSSFQQYFEIAYLTKSAEKNNNFRSGLLLVAGFRYIFEF